MRHFELDTSRFFRCVVRLCASKMRSSETKIANPKQVCYCFPVPKYHIGYFLFTLCSHVVVNHIGINHYAGRIAGVNSGDY